MATDTFSIMTFLANDPSVSIMAAGSMGFDYLSNKSAYKDLKKATQLREDNIRMQASYELQGIQVSTFIQEDAIRTQAEVERTNALTSSAKQVNRAATEGVSGENISILYAVEDAKQARADTREQVQLELNAAQGDLKAEALLTKTEGQIESIWNDTYSKEPSFLTSAVKTVGDVYTSYRSEAQLRKKFDTFARDFDQTNNLNVNPEPAYSWSELGTDIKDSLSSVGSLLTGVQSK